CFYGHLVHLSLLRLPDLRGQLGVGHRDGDAEGAQDVPAGRHHPGSAYYRGHGDHDPLDLVGGNAAFLDGGGVNEVGDGGGVHRDQGGQPDEHVVTRREGIVIDGGGGHVGERVQDGRFGTHESLR